MRCARNAGLLAMLLALVTPVHSQSQSERVNQFCSVIRSFTEFYIAEKEQNPEQRLSFNSVFAKFAQTRNLRRGEYLENMSLMYALNVDILRGRKAVTLGHYAFADCVAGHTEKKVVPIETAEAREKLQTILKKCEDAGGDNIGVCVQGGLKPLLIDLPMRTSASNQTPVPNSSISPLGLLKHTHERWLALVANKYKCSTPKITSVSPNNTRVAGVISERWQADVCGQQRTFFPILSPDGQGGYLVAFGE